jgi:hypothetical protein
LRHLAIEFHVLDLTGGIAGQRNEDEAGQSAHRLPHAGEDLEQAATLSSARPLADSTSI